MTSSSRDSDTSIPKFPLLLLEEQPDPLPKWMAFYARASYIWFGIHIVYSWLHLAFVAYLLDEQLFRIQFQPAYDFLAYNSYSILSPMLCTLCILIYHVRKKIKLDDGDFFGVVGILLFLCLILCYDATGIYHLYSKTSKSLDNKHFDTIKEDPHESNELSWQYAWSTKPTCARVHSRMNLKANEEKAKEDERNKNVVGPKIESSEDHHGEINSWMFEGLSKSDLEQGFLSAVIKRAIDPETTTIAVAGENTTYSADTDSNKTVVSEAEAAPRHEVVHSNKDLTPDEIGYENDCNKTADSIVPIDKPRDWMIQMQEKLECCGPYGLEEWKKKVTDLSSCKDFKVGCAPKFNEYIMSFFLSTLLIMYVECIFYAVSILFACFHYAAMKYDEGHIAKEYSLLNIRDDGFTVVEVNGDEQQETRKKRNSVLPKGLAPHDPVQDLFLQANHHHLAHKGRRSTIDTHFPAAFSLAHARLRNNHPPIRHHASHTSAGRRLSHPHNIGHHHSPQPPHATIAAFKKK